jgi:hypothetical protein
MGAGHPPLSTPPASIGYRISLARETCYFVPRGFPYPQDQIKGADQVHADFGPNIAKIEFSILGGMVQSC